MIYLASPYSHPDPEIREQRFQATCAATAALMIAGHKVFSPVVYGHPLTEHRLPGDWTFWKSHARWHLERCDEVVVLMLDGWDGSDGVRAEIELAGELGKVVWYRYPVRVMKTSGRGRTVDEWKLRPERGDNHWFDCLVGAAVAASMQRASLDETGPARPHRKPRISLAAMQQAGRRERELARASNS